MLVAMIEYAPTIDSSVEDVLKSAQYTVDSFARFSVGNQPLITLVSARLALEGSFTDTTNAFLLMNAKEELNGADGEGPHCALATNFFAQVVSPRNKHRTSVDSYVNDVLREGSPQALLGFMATVEAWSTRAMPIIGERMSSFGASDMKYIEVHMQVDGGDDGHAAQFTEALVREKITGDEIERGIVLFRNLFGTIFGIKKNNA